MLTKTEIISAAEEAGLPNGWYKGLYFDGRVMKQGMSPQLLEFVRLILTMHDMKSLHTSVTQEYREPEERK